MTWIIFLKEVAICVDLSTVMEFAGTHPLNIVSLINIYNIQ